jgi:phytoene dehydrogenase-like protein
MSKHYDAVVLGGSIGALTAAALLARRSWRVLVVGHGHRPATYAFDGLPLARRTFTLLAAASPAWGRILVELAQSQTFRRRTIGLDPMFQVLGPKVRLDVPPDLAAFGREIDREYPEVRRVVDELYAELARTNAAADAAFDRDFVWPPGTFWERRETGRVLQTLPYVNAAGDGDFLAEFPRDHAYRTVLEVPARFASALAGRLPPFALARLHGAWTRGVVRLARGEDELVDFLLERIRAHGGEARMNDRAKGIVQRAGKIEGLVLAGEETLGVQFVLADTTARALLDLAGMPSRARGDEGPVVVPREHRFVVSLVVGRCALPARLAAEAFLLPGPAGATRSAVHLQTHAPFPGLPDDAALLVAETILDAGVSVRRAREAVLATIEAYVPFVERHYLVVDSPHDGRPLWDYRSGTRVEVDRAQMRRGGGSVDAEPMVPRLAVEPTSLHGLAGEAIRTSLAGAFLVGRSTLPALGQEGELLAAWGAARIITRTDRRKERMRREMWSRVELG